MSNKLFHARLIEPLTVVLTLSLSLLGSITIAFGQVNNPVFTPLRDHMPPIVFRSQVVDRVDPRESISLALTLPLRNEAELDAMLSRLYNPRDLSYGAYLTTQQFTDNFAPTQDDYNKVAAFAESQGLTITHRHSNRLVLDVSGPAAIVEGAFGVRLLHFQKPDGTLFRSPDSNPSVPASIASRLTAVVGLDTASRWKTHSVGRPVNQLGTFSVKPLQTGSGPGGGLTPSDIKNAYNLTGSTQTGAGQILGVFELDGYTASDVTHYETSYSLPNVPLQNILVDGFNGSAGAGAGEVTLDIELQIAIAPGASKVLVYEGPNSGNGVIDTYNRIASDNLAKQISTSWGLYESGSNASTLNAESNIYKQMAAQGQSIYAAAGDSGAYDDGSTLSVDDPASQPYVVGVGGTKLTTNGPGGAWKSETTWNGGSIANGGGGGGISSFWSIPSWQISAVTSSSKGSTTKRNVPDVSLDADPNSGYSIYYKGAWYIFGGTSCASPLWAGFTALVNQQRIASGHGTLGFANPALYAIGAGANYPSNFHDIADGSTNLFYPAVAGYDEATGWGSFNGGNLLISLAGGTAPPPPPPPTQLIVNPGFENGSNATPWIATSGVVDSTASVTAHSGSWKAWLNGYGSSHTDTLSQQVAIPSTITTATLTFWLKITTSETTKTLLNDTLKAQVRDSNGVVLATLATYSNLNSSSGYVQKTFDLSAYKGKTVQIYFIGVENGSRATSFLLDDFALNVQ